MRLAEIVLQPVGLERCAGMVAEREQQVVVERLESALAVRAHDHALEAVEQVERDRDEVLDLRVGRVVAVGRRVLAHDPVALEHLAGESLYDRAAARVLIKPVRAHRVELPVAVGVAAREQQALLGLDELDRGAEDQVSRIDWFVVCPAHHVLVLQLGAELAVEIALRAAAALQPLDQLAAPHELSLVALEVRAQAVALRQRAREPLLGRHAGRMRPAQQRHARRSQRDPEHCFHRASVAGHSDVPTRLGRLRWRSVPEK
jgi:hypothetical protein